MAHLRVVGEAGNGQDALTLAASQQPDVMLVDIGMKDMNGLVLTERLCAQHPAIRVLILSMYDNPEYVSRAMCAGARGYVLKDAGSHEIIAAIDAVAAGGSYYSAGVAPIPRRRPLPERARARSADPAGAGLVEQGDCPAAGHQRAHRRNPPPERAAQAGNRLRRRVGQVCH